MAAVASPAFGRSLITIGFFGRGLSIHRPPRRDRPELLDAAAADADIPVVEIDGRVAMAGDQADLVAEPKPVGGRRNREPAVLVGGSLIGRRGLVTNQRRA